MALKYGYMVFVCNTERSRRSEIEYIEEILKRNVDGIIYNTYSNSEEMLNFLRSLSQKLPVVYTNHLFQEDEPVSYVYTDGFESNREAVHFLYEKGRTAIGYIRNTTDISVIEDRYEGYLQGLRDCGIPFREEYVYRAKQSTEPDYIALGADAAKYYEGLDATPKAVIAAIDALAIGCVQQFQKDGIGIPEQVNVIGFDNISLSSLIQPPLTTISQPIRLIGQKAAEIIIAKLDGREIEDKVVFREILFCGRLQIFDLPGNPAADVLHRFFSKFMLSACDLYFCDYRNIFIIKMIFNKTMESFRT